MPAPAKTSALDSVFYALGFMAEDIEGIATGKPSAVLARIGSRIAAAAAPGAGESAGPETGPEPSAVLLDGPAARIGAIAAGWVLARTFRPRRVAWHRAIPAGLAAAAFQEAARALVGGRDGDGHAAGGPAGARLAHYAGGIGTAFAYAALIYPRLPGPAIARGLAFGALQAALEPMGGPVALIRRVAPDISLPFERLLRPAPAENGALPHLAFGFGLGLVYDDGSGI